MKILALDVGATKIAVSQLDESHAVQERRQIPSNVGANIWPDLASVLQEFEADRIGIASAGPINVRTGRISPINIHQWRDFPIVRELNELFPNVPIGLLGDGTAVALAENKIGAGVGSENMLGLSSPQASEAGLSWTGKRSTEKQAMLLFSVTIPSDSTRIFGAIAAVSVV